jgi:hypothetical protein|tara:strand:+ start:49 stop:972 length:924 start_codon:yes stop_codon:yes gene_type:complete
MLKKLFFIILLILTLPSNAQEDLFPIDSLPYDAIINSTLGGKRMKYYGKLDFTLSQAYFENWVSGGENAFNGILHFDYNFNFSSRKGWVWDTNLMISLGGNKTSSNKIIKKADDRFEINSQLGKQINQFWNYAFSLNFKSQLLPGFKYFNEDGVEKRNKSTRIFSPTIIQSGVGWYYKKNSNSWVNFSPIAARGILVGAAYTRELAEGQKYFGVEKGKTSLINIGGSINGYLKLFLVENITLENKFNVYGNYIQKVQNIDFELNTILRMKVNRRISSNLIVHFIYDDDLIGRLQIRELFGAGLSVDL